MFGFELRVVRDGVHEGLLGGEVGRRVFLGDGEFDGVEGARCCFQGAKGRTVALSLRMRGGF